MSTSILIFFNDFSLLEMNLSGDAASGAFVSMATSCPELLINCISTFVSGGDIGVGTIVGSAACNMLVIPALCGLFTCASIQLDWWTISRDCSFYFVAVIALIAVINDSQIMWYEAAFLVLCYVVYLIGESTEKKIDFFGCSALFYSVSAANSNS